MTTQEVFNTCMQEKYATNDYICISGKTKYQQTKWLVVSNPTQFSFGKFILIHIKHKPILDAYLADNSVEIQEQSGESWNTLTNFVNYYTESRNYRLAPLRTIQQVLKEEQ